MKPPVFGIASYRADQVVRTALVLSGQLFDLREVWRFICAGEAPPAWVEQSIADLLQHWQEVEPPLRRLAERACAVGTQQILASAARPMNAIAPPLIPARIFCAASNYIEHANEMGTALAAKASSRPYMFLKTASSVIGPNDTVRIPPETKTPDWEVELAAVIGRRARRVSAEQALDFVACYTIVNDVSARDLTRRTDYPFKHDWFQGKNHDTFCPIGPWLVPARFVPDPQNLRLRLSVNGEWMQDGNTAVMIWTLREQLAYLSTIVTLMPGDVIATGTPTGVGMGRGVFLKPGDVMVAEVEGLGEIRNPVEAEVL